jgi:mitochondrial-processing peptidase subunit alpha
MGMIIVLYNLLFTDVFICRKPVDYFLKAIDAITLKDISSLAEKIISSPLTMASWGDGMLMSLNNCCNS